jgi:hypothetical protein
MPGAIAWAATGLLLALLVRLLPPWHRTSWPLTLLLGLAAGGAGGLLATLLGFGGLDALDFRSLVAAALAALLALLLLAIGRVSARAAAAPPGGRPPAG